MNATPRASGTPLVDGALAKALQQRRLRSAGEAGLRDPGAERRNLRFGHAPDNKAFGALRPNGDP